MSRFVLPKPISEDSHIFEDLVRDVMARYLNCQNLQRYGRNGQSQYGVDVVGITNQGIVGIQCKHHPSSEISTSEVDTIIISSEDFEPKLNLLYIITSANRDNTPLSHVLECTRQRHQLGEYPVEIKFWEDLVGWLSDYPDLVYKYFTQFFSIDQLEHVYVPTIVELQKVTSIWPLAPEELKNSIISQLGIPLVTPYRLSIGISTFHDNRFDGLVDLQLLLDQYFEQESSSEADFVEFARVLHEVKTLFNNTFYSKELRLYINVRLSLAYLIGWTFRRVAMMGDFSLNLVEKGQIWTTQDLPEVQTNLDYDLPELLDPTSNEVVIVLNISRETDRQVKEYVKGWPNQPKAILVWDLDTHKVRSAAHALSLGREISRRIKALVDKNSVTHIHLFGALPASLATLIGFHLNGICPISLYFRDGSRQSYGCGGTLHNQL